MQGVQQEFARGFTMQPDDDCPCIICPILLFCGETHKWPRCEMFLNLSPEERAKKTAEMQKEYQEQRGS